MNSMQPLLLRTSDAADMISVSRSYLYELIAKGTIPSIRVGGAIRVPISALKEWVDREVAARKETSAA